jgi:hypothetical protein
MKSSPTNCTPASVTLQIIEQRPDPIPFFGETTGSTTDAQRAGQLQLRSPASTVGEVPQSPRDSHEEARDERPMTVEEAGKGEALQAGSSPKPSVATRTSRNAPSSGAGVAVHGSAALQEPPNRA